MNPPPRYSRAREDRYIRPGMGNLQKVLARRRAREEDEKERQLALEEAKRLSDKKTKVRFEAEKQVAKEHDAKKRKLVDEERALQSAKKIRSGTLPAQGSAPPLVDTNKSPQDRDFSGSERSHAPDVVDADSEHERLHEENEVLRAKIIDLEAQLKSWKGMCKDAIERSTKGSVLQQQEIGRLTNELARRQEMIEQLEADNKALHEELEADVPAIGRVAEY